ncbi:NAD-dependent succinate-semialdehyde dehydrogenase [Arenibacter sp. BSSL-BM3]|uniref:NAD-dependent succinate-semialdehyde dehydrogenase n=1 Tax=Arenibacter arenosicollis TaxID=2762274 RepID=A0ABR7QSL9_9FLAO|nr:NAD-dependent succinate-semialdehyde dehydrogenase [Arenibacter arenosicollis]MBC8770182.1 NAD-dependent succinate-semialdehyde dehydrogenase [Arenibacter arenosicollis]
MEYIESVNPYNGEPLEKYRMFTEGDIKAVLEKADISFKSWKNEAVEYRSGLLKNLAKALLKNKKVYAQLMSKEMGKPLNQGIAEIEKCAWACDFYAKNAVEFLADDLIDTEANESFISYDSMGCILAIMPWNFPFWQVIRFAAPTLTAGNTVILKHASNVPGCGLALQELFTLAGYPEGSFQFILADHKQLESIIGNPIVQGVTLTGSEKAGRAIAAEAGKHLKKSVMELGGNNACIVWEDADLDSYMDTMVMARMQNTGQSCIAAKRFIVLEEIYDEFLMKFRNKVQTLKSGDPLDKETDIGVMAREDLAKTLAQQVKESVDKGAKVLYGNNRRGAYYEPTVLTGVVPGMPAFDEELFGPVAAIVKAKDREEAIALAANSKFGLGSMLFTEDIKSARKIIGDIPDGAFFINEMVKSDPRLPFGGTKASGYGRELSMEGMLEFVNKKTVYINK